jgi:uncharacterized membrane protein
MQWRTWPNTALFLTLAMAGMAVSAYLTAAHYGDFTLACSSTGIIDCGAVTHSPYAQLLGTRIPVSAAGLAWFLAMSLLGLARAWTETRGLDPTGVRGAACVLGAAGVAFALYLVYVEIVVIHRICEWCTAAHLLALGLLLLSLHDLRDDDMASPRRRTAGAGGSVPGGDGA